MEATRGEGDVAEDDEGGLQGGLDCAEDVVSTDTATAATVCGSDGTASRGGCRVADCHLRWPKTGPWS